MTHIIENDTRNRKGLNMTRFSIWLLDILVRKLCVEQYVAL